MRRLPWAWKRCGKSQGNAPRVFCPAGRVSDLPNTFPDPIPGDSGLIVISEILQNGAFPVARKRIDPAFLKKKIRLFHSFPQKDSALPQGTDYLFPTREGKPSTGV
jgi:hypothetical protein